MARHAAMLIPMPSFYVYTAALLGDGVAVVSESGFASVIQLH